MERAMKMYILANVNMCVSVIFLYGNNAYVLIAYLCLANMKCLILPAVSGIGRHVI